MARSQLADHLLQYDLISNDSYWVQLVETVRSYDPKSTVLLTSPGGPGLSADFRQVAYYLPGYHVYALGWDKSSNFGHLFTAFEGKNDYSVEGLETAACYLTLPPATSRLIIQDQTLASFLGETIPSYSRSFSEHGTVTVGLVPESSTLVLSGSLENGQALIAARSRRDDDMPRASAESPNRSWLSQSVPPCHRYPHDVD